jgi:hypothetical protein
MQVLRLLRPRRKTTCSLQRPSTLAKRACWLKELKSLAGLEGEERKRKGAELNKLKASLESIFASRQKELLDELDALPPLDLTQPG